MGGGYDMLASDRYYELTSKWCVYNIMPISNIPSVLQHGVVCFEKMQEIHHTSIAMNEVQERRSQVEIPNGLPLHQYANLYFSHHNPMLYKRRDMATDLCVLALSATILDIEGCVVSDRNAAVWLARFYSPIEGMERLNFDWIHAKYWTDDNPIIQREKKAIKCAEVLVPGSVPADYIVGAYVVNEKAKQELLAKGFTGQIHVSASVFFR